MSSKDFKDNSPNAAKLIESLRSTGYDNYAAVADIIDNSFDAGAKNVWFNLVPTKEDFTLTISDDGGGMTEEVLDQAMRLGSQTDRSQDSDLGRFGMGLITASLSMARRLKVITKNANGETLTAIQDVDDIIDENSFTKELREATKEERSEFAVLTNESETGTVIKLTKLDQLQNENINEFANKLKKDLGQIFRIFIDSGKKIFIRGTEVKIVDPLFLNHNETEVFSDESYEIKVNGKTESIRLRIAGLPSFKDDDEAKDNGIGQLTQGFYILRNNREVAAAETLGIFTRHNYLNRFRAEIFFSGNMDELMGVNFMKKNLKPKQSVIDKIHSVAYPQIQTIRKRASRSRPKVTDKDIDHKRAAEIISKKSNLLIKPKAKIERRSPQGGKGSSSQGAGENSPRKPSNSRSSLSSKVNVEFQLRKMGTSGPFFESDQAGKTTIVTYNVEHPFYIEMFSQNKNNQNVINALDFLSYSLASAQLLSMNDENLDVFDNFFSVFSSNLRTLIK